MFLSIPVVTNEACIPLASTKVDPSCRCSFKTHRGPFAPTSSTTWAHVRTYEALFVLPIRKPVPKRRDFFEPKLDILTTEALFKIKIYSIEYFQE